MRPSRQVYSMRAGLPWLSFAVPFMVGDLGDLGVAALQQLRDAVAAVHQVGLLGGVQHGATLSQVATSIVGIDGLGLDLEAARRHEVQNVADRAQGGCAHYPHPRGQLIVVDVLWREVLGEDDPTVEEDQRGGLSGHERLEGDFLRGKSLDLLLLERV